MENKHFITLSASATELEPLDEPALSAQVAFWAHMADRSLFAGKLSMGDLSHPLEMLTQRLDLFSTKFDTGSGFYHWADEVRSLCVEALADPAAFVYPKQSKLDAGLSSVAFDTLMKGRRSVREYNGEPVDDALILQILGYGAWAPSSCNMQGLRYIVMKSAEAKEKIKRNGIDVGNAACVIAVLADMRLYCDSDAECACHDSGAAIQNMLLACHQLGLGACYISDTSLNGPKFRALLPVQEHEKVTALVSIGHYDSTPMAPGRINAAKVTRFI
jgi:nitroreductase